MFMVSYFFGLPFSHRHFTSGASLYTFNMVLYTGAPLSHPVYPAFFFTSSLSVQKPGSAGCLGSNGLEGNAAFTLWLKGTHMYAAIFPSFPLLPPPFHQRCLLTPKIWFYTQEHP
ncbi:hypothetical protein XELAEV_18046663mg [Xenopus laevis]|uniref:Uncharacterized protein n=1 Tax=Xenopus laevis TaxID=8355 RepID=A0A974BTI1_XENLA|nr:hypothetical protein XELAEV_18046663mg [Xenopus laevis]